MTNSWTPFYPFLWSEMRYKYLITFTGGWATGLGYPTGHLYEDYPCWIRTTGNFDPPASRLTCELSTG